MTEASELRYCRLELPISFPCHGLHTNLPDRVYLVAEGPTAVFGFMRVFSALQYTSAGSPGLYYFTYVNGVQSSSTQVQAFGEHAISGTITFDHQGTPDGRSQVRVWWNARLLEELTVPSLVSGVGNFHRLALYFISDPAYQTGMVHGVAQYAFTESARLGRLGGCVYGEPREDGSSPARGSRHLDWDDWYNYNSQSISHEGQARYVGVRQGIWAGQISCSNHLRVSEGLLWADGETPVPNQVWRLGTDYLQLYVYGEKRGGSALCAVTDRAYRTKLARADEGGGKVLYRRIERAADPATYGAETTVRAGADLRHPALAAYDDGVVTCWYMAGGEQQASLSTDDGRTWSELSDMMGNDLRNVAVTQHHGITLGVGVKSGRLYFVRSNDQGRTQDPQPGGAGAMQLIGECAEDCRPCLCWYPDGEVAVWAEDESGEVVTYTNASSGYGAWRRV